jgi:hypothetical protein
VPGKPEKSLLIKAVRYQGPPHMPPAGKLPQKQIEALTRWVEMGLPWPGASDTHEPKKPGPFRITSAQRDFWSFRPVKPPLVPAVKNVSWPSSPIDRFILAGLERKGLAPARPADKRALLRRVTFDLTGLPPTPREMAAFLADGSPGAFARVVDRLLASPAYGEHWGRHWLDVVRYADARDLIQLPAASDFREIWRYRDWVVGAFNQDMPYREFVQYQVAGDLLQPKDAADINSDALVATGLLALADFVPGDVDKDLMIADYVNDQIDVVGRAFLGLTLACARCHDHKSDPVSTEDYYGLAGIFFSTRLVPGPVPGNTPLVRVPLVSQATIDRARVRFESARRRQAEVQQQLASQTDQECRGLIERLVTTRTARYLMAACEYRYTARKSAVSLGDFARRHKLHEYLLERWLDYLGADRTALPEDWRKNLHDASAGKLDRPALERSARTLEKGLAAEAKRSPKGQAPLLHFRADDPHLKTSTSKHVTLWPGRGQADAAPPAGTRGPLAASATINGRARPVLRFTGRELLEVPGRVPPTGSLFAVCRVSRPGPQRLLGWEDAAVGRHGVGLMPTAGGGWHAILRNNGVSGDVVHARRAMGDFEIVSVTWGARGTTLHRDRAPAGTNRDISSVSADPAIAALRIGGPGSGGGPSFQGDLAELRVYDSQLSETARARVEAELFATWFTADGQPPAPLSPITRLYRELISPRGPYWPKTGDRTEFLPLAARARLAALRKELETLKGTRPPVVPMAVAVQDGGPKGTRHEGFRDAHVFIRGNHKKLGKKVPRRFPIVLAGDRQAAITQGSGRLELARWLTGPDSPLTARVMVNRIWQHHFGEGLVRTPNNFGERGERPTHPELLDYLADQFVRSGWSVKAMHRLILLSSAYQQSSVGRIGNPSYDPDNRLFGRMNRRRLGAEAIRDSLLSVAGNLDRSMGGPAFAEMAVPRRTLYLMSVRTGATGFAALFDRADPNSIVEKRGATTTAPQALFFLNDPFVADQARALARRVAREAPGREERTRRLYEIVYGRAPTRAEAAIARRLLAAPSEVDPWERYCHTVLCANELLYID